MSAPVLQAGSAEARAIHDLMSNQRLVTIEPSSDRLTTACRVVQWLAAEYPLIDILFLVDQRADLGRLGGRLRRRFTQLTYVEGRAPWVEVTTGNGSSAGFTVRVASPCQARYAHAKPSADLVVIEPHFLAHFDTILVGFNKASQILLTAPVDDETMLDCRAKLGHGMEPAFRITTEVLLAGAP